MVLALSDLLLIMHRSLSFCFFGRNKTQNSQNELAVSSSPAALSAECRRVVSVIRAAVGGIWGIRRKRDYIKGMLLNMGILHTVSTPVTAGRGHQSRSTGDPQSK